AQVASALKARPEEVPDRIATLMDERRKLEAEVAELRRQVALGGGANASGPTVEEVGGTKLIAQVLTGISPKDLRGLIDEHKTSLGSGVVALIADADGKAAAAVGVTDDLKDTVSAVDLVKLAVEKLGGKGGGGRPDMAQGGGPDASGGEAALDAIRGALAA
ncbi:MAG: DHHA1 domain-containing protein, partial [Pseudomonadota bacterium]